MKALPTFCMHIKQWTSIFFGSNMLACQCFFVGQSVLYKKAEKAEKSVQPVVAVPRLGGSWHVSLEM